MQSLYQDLAIRGIKLLDIGWAAAAYFILALSCVYIIDKISPKFDQANEDKKSSAYIVAQIIVRIWLIGVLSYFARNLFQLVPWPFEGVYGYKHMNVKDVANSAVFVAFFVVFDTTLQKQVATLKSRSAF